MGAHLDLLHRILGLHEHLSQGSAFLLEHRQDLLDEQDGQLACANRRSADWRARANARR